MIAGTKLHLLTVFEVNPIKPTAMIVNVVFAPHLAVGNDVDADVYLVVDGVLRGADDARLQLLAETNHSSLVVVYIIEGVVLALPRIPPPVGQV